MGHREIVVVTEGKDPRNIGLVQTIHQRGLAACTLRRIEESQIRGYEGVVIQAECVPEVEGIHFYGTPVIIYSWDRTAQELEQLSVAATHRYYVGKESSDETPGNLAFCTRVAQEVLTHIAPHGAWFARSMHLTPEERETSLFFLGR